MLHLEVAEGVHRIEDAYTNWYAIEDGDELTIVDTGHPRSWASLHELVRARRRLPTAVVLTHAHFDHMGFAERARAKLAVTVHAHEQEVPVTRHRFVTTTSGAGSRTCSATPDSTARSSR
jgi:glyoxylase-like metal-dependent hydrolase (beta-lactamase superfamily II)